MRVLAGDIGGTKTALAWIEIDPSRLSIEREQIYPSADYESLESIVQAFLSAGRERPRACGFGVAGPVKGGVAKITKLPWTVDARRLSRQLGRPVALVNDFVAAALGVSYLSPRSLVRIVPGRAEKDGPRAILGAGTGLGEAGILRAGGRQVVFPSEGGHADFGPRDPKEDALVLFLRRRFERVTSDRILSGEGLGHLYDFLAGQGTVPESPEVRRRLEQEDDRAAVISRAALEGGDELCRETLTLFVSIYGSEAGNVALRYRATGGVFVAGGISPKILPALRKGPFMVSFRAKPPHEKLLGAIPVDVVLETRLGLFGAAAAAAYRMEMETARPSSKTMARRAVR
jgi:glucokinase